MSPVIRIPGNLHQRLEKHAVGFDTPANVIERLLDIIEGIEPMDRTESVVLKNNKTLPIKLDPEDVGVFKDLLVEKKKANIKIIYNDGRTETKSWNASRFTEKSNVFGNLRSRPDFRNGVWQDLGIEEVVVSII